MATDDALNDRESDPRSRIVFRAMEPLEDAEEFAGVARVETDTVVFDEIDDFTAPFVELGSNNYLRGVLAAGVLERIGEEVHDHPFQQRLVTPTARERPDRDIQVTPWKFGPEGEDRLFDERSQINGLSVDLGAAQARELEEIGDQRRHLARPLANHVQVAARSIGELGGVLFDDGSDALHRSPMPATTDGN